jgi:hypothetical protein
VYKFLDDATRDLAVVKVLSGHKTPLQKVLKGSRTVEGFLDGAGTLSIIDDRGHTKSYDFASANTSREVIVRVGEVMQWAADSSTDLTFYEICEPPYEDGRFENIAE